MESLVTHLEKFKEDLNKNEKLKPLLKNWNINVIIKVLDLDEVYTFVVRRGVVLEILKNMKHYEKNFEIEAVNDTFIEIFSGKLSPTEAILDGEMASFGNSKDEDILDAITLVIWGIY